MGRLLGKAAKETGEGIKDAFEGLDKFFDNAFTSKEEKAQKRNEYEQIKGNIVDGVNQALTDRHRIDMNSDSWLSKNVRPLTLLYLLLFTSTITVIDAILDSFNVPKEYITLWGTLLMATFSYYFVGREITKNSKLKLLPDSKPLGSIGLLK